MKIDYTKDECGKSILTDASGKHQVMMEWEKDYMKKCIQKLNPHGKVLEIGFGMAYSAQEIVDHPDVEEYTVIECSPEVWKKFYDFQRMNAHKCKMNLVRGRWQDVLHTCGKFDCCFFDDYDYENNAMRFLDFSYRFLSKHCDVGARLGVYSSSPIQFTIGGAIVDKGEKFETEIPEYCNYAREVWIPIIHKVEKNIKFPKLEKIDQDVCYFVKDNFKNFEDCCEIFGKVFEVDPNGDWLLVQFLNSDAFVKISNANTVLGVKDRVVISKHEKISVYGETNLTRLKATN